MMGNCDLPNTFIDPYYTDLDILDTFRQKAHRLTCIRASSEMQSPRCMVKAHYLPAVPKGVYLRYI